MSDDRPLRVLRTTPDHVPEGCSAVALWSIRASRLHGKRQISEVRATSSVAGLALTGGGATGLRGSASQRAHSADL